MHAGVGDFLLLELAAWLVVCFPAYVVAQRRHVTYPGVAFVPYVGATIVLLRSMRSNPWACLLILVPIVNLLFLIWMAFALPVRHERSLLWGIVLLPVLSVVGMWFYALTLPREKTSLAGYHTIRRL